MAKESFRCRLITPEARVLDEDVTYVSLPLWDGLAGILPNRAPFVAKLGLGELTMDFPEGGRRSYLLEDGFGQMYADTLTILAQKAIPVETLSEEDAKAELAEAAARASTQGDEMRAITRDRERARLKVRLARGFRERGGI